MWEVYAKIFKLGVYNSPDENNPSKHKHDMKVSKEALNKVHKNEQLRDYIIHKLNVEKKI